MEVMAELLRLLGVLTAVIMVESMERSSMYMKNTGSEDLETSGTGYNYQVNSGKPFSYSNYDSSDSSPEKFNNFAYPPLAYGQYKYNHLPLESIPLSQTYVPRHYDKLVNSYGVPLSYAAYVEPVKGYEAFIGSAKTGLPDAIYYGQDTKNFLKSGGSSFEDAEKAAHGEKGERAYLNKDAFEKGLKGSHDKEEKKGFLNKSGGIHSGSFDVAAHYNDKNQKGSAHRGESFSGKKDHKKDSKTTGYHNVYHKDEYKKDHSFYDKADKSGHFRKYGDYDAKRGSKEGSFKKGGQHDSGFKEGDYGVKGFSDKGRFVDEAQGYKKAAGHDKFYQNNAEYAKKGGNAFAKEDGYKDGDKFDFGGH